MIRITDDTVISEGDIVYRFSRSAGPGGQNVNKLNTRVTLLFDIDHSRGLTAEQKQRLFDRLSSRISDDGLLTVVSQRHRTQSANRKSAQNRLVELLKAALRDMPVRKQTGVPHGEKQKRLRRKRRRSEIKQMRRPVTID
ncbi:MAG: alternative ribosome rescue aminoacyl-tRNA hydrolase ArfB [Sedimentisphaerales bacterium]|jgi:ribosome-associated protein